jgi:ankyrin repeat protein
MNRSHHLAAPVGIMLVAAVAGCGMQREPKGSVTPQETSSRAEPSVPVTPPSESPVPATKPTLSPAEQARLDEQLRDSAWDNDVAKARQLIRRGADVNAKDDTVQSAYLIATSEGYLDLLRLTLGTGAEVDDKDSWNGTGLIRAAERGHYSVVGELLQAGIDRNHVNRIGHQAIHEAVWLGEDTDTYAATLRVLAAGGVQLDNPSRDEGLTPLQMAQSRGYEDLERVLTRLTTGKPPADADAALLRAAAEGDADGVALALRAGANPEARDASRRTALLLAVTQDHVDVAKVLVALGADPDALDDRHDTPWLVTGVTGSVRMLEALLPANPDMTIENRYGGLSVIPASERGHVNYVRRVVRTGIDVNHINQLGWTALLEAIILGDGGPRYQEIVRILLAAGADRTIRDADGVSALGHATAKGYEQIERILTG